MIDPPSVRDELNEEIFISELDDPIYELDNLFDRGFEYAEEVEYRIPMKN